MILEPTSYVPSLRWRMGEYQGLLTLSSAAKDKIVPILTIPPLEYDFDTGVPRKTPHEHVFPFPKRLKAKWGTRPFWFDIHSTLRHSHMNEGQSCYQYVFEEIRKFGAHGIPIVSFDMDEKLVRDVSSINSADQHGMGLRVMMEDIMKPDFAATKAAIVKAMGIAIDEIDLIIDLEAPNYDPIDAFSSALAGVLQGFPDLKEHRNVVLVGTSFPSSMGEISKGITAVQRKHWSFYNSVIAKLPNGFRVPNFGDYTTVHPGFVAMDMRMIKPAGKIIYATNESWQIIKGGSFRDSPEQMHSHAATVVNSDFYFGDDYCYGDNYIRECANKNDGPSNLSQWKKVGINHHMSVTLAQLSNPSATASYLG